MKKTLFSIFCISSAFISAQVTGSKTVGADYASLAAAINDLNTNGVGAGGVTFNIPADYTEIAPSGGFTITATGTAANPIKFVKSGIGANPTFTASDMQVVSTITDAVFKIVGGDYITLDGLTLQENAANTVLVDAATNNMTEFGVALLTASTTDGAQNNTVQNCTISLNRLYRNSFGIYSNVLHSSTDAVTLANITSATGANSNNKFYTNAISNVNVGLSFIGSLTAAFMDTGNDIGGTSAGTGNTLTNWGGNSTFSAYVAIVTNSLGIYDTNQMGENFSYNTVTSASLTSPVTIFGILKFYNGGQPAGTFTSNVNNNTVSVANTPTTATVGTIVCVSSQGLTPLLATATLNINNNIVQNSTISGAVSTTVGISGISNSSVPGIINLTGNIVQNNSINATTSTIGGITCLSNSGAAGTANLTGNSILNNSITSPAATGAIMLGIINSGAVATSNINNNILRGFATTSTSGQMQSILSTGAVTTAVNINNNQLGNTDGGLLTASAANSGTLFGVLAQGLLPAASLSIQNNDIRGIVYNTTSSASQNYIQFTHASATTDNILNNTFTNLNINSTGSVGFIVRGTTGGNMTATGVENVNNNSIVTGFNKTAAGGTISLYSAAASSVSGSIMNQTGNNFSNITFTGATAMNGWNNTEGASGTNSPAKNISGNTFTNWNGGISAVLAITSNFGANNTIIANNVIDAISSQGTLTGISIGASNGGTQSLSGNTVSNLLTSAISATGILFGASNGQNVFKNKIVNISATGAATAANSVSGISATGIPLTFNIYNNVIGKLSAPAGNGTDVVRGISFTGTTALSTIKLYYNSVYLDAVSTGTNFGTSALYHTFSTTATSASLDSRNNIFINNSTPAGTGTAASFRRSAATNLNNYAASSNNNLYYAGTSAAGNIIYSDGTNNDQTLAAFKSRVSTRDAVSQTENTTFQSIVGPDPNFLKIAAGTVSLAESGAQSISTITDDYFGIARPFFNPTNGGTATDIGASEFDGKITTLAVSDTTSKQGVSIYREGQNFTVRSSSAKITTVEVIEATGRTLLKNQSNSDSVSIPAERLNIGVYLIKVTLQNGTQTLLKIRK
ncbi:beta strand repeat-containing protein [Halpernia frigidisoli]|uniref:Uncharacterized protein n=1 Tax=Halpernia frigidisoli TaxID=1125876 RepID=A0A1I3FM76_9FLAO|nr:T9SS type A sorting domain-containing protein [Halpernia frigidisoli]SFI12290.1 hypothetical protein SAMN05443292_1474 [Halpernia frigidisoli]